MTELNKRENSGPRRHHYVPAFLLQGFTPSGRRDELLWVHDLDQGNVRQSTPDQTGLERDYYRVEIAKVDPNAVETAFAQVEGRVSPIIQGMTLSHQLPVGEDFEVLIGFVTLLALRSPSVRALYERGVEQLEKERLRILFSSQECFDQIVEEERKAGREVPAGVTYESVRRFADTCAVRIPSTTSVQMVLKIWPRLIPVFLERNWSLLFTRPENASFICSDMPVSVTPTSPDFKARFLGFGQGATELTVPLSRSMVLVGSYEVPSVAMEMPMKYIRDVNQRTISFAERFLYSAERGIVGMAPNQCAAQDG